jgi:crotonobetainyl-CoA:carnitine CoA-transferase CaiB-like acyl-CoA transferase
MRGYPELFASLNANKRSIVLDLKANGDRARALALAADADVVIEGFRPGVMTRLGVGPDDVAAVNPVAIYCSVSGLGQTGPLASASGHDLNYQAWAGSLAPDGGAPAIPAIPVADLAAGMSAALGVCAALVGRARNGTGEVIDVAMADVLATWTGAAAPRAEGVDPEARGVAGYGVFSTADEGRITLGVLTEDHFWRALCTTLGLTDVADLGFTARSARVAELQARLEDAIAQWRRDDVVAALLAVAVPVAPVLDRAGMVALEHFRARGVVGADPWADPAAGYPIRFVHRPARRVSAPPGLDEHRGCTFHDRA